ncbi:RRM domain-containing protein [Mycena kentingensis (nom. inval.)]|nr:RRM domain-containing protein [Mycena kentingensis (nom. inval.)]
MASMEMSLDDIIAARPKTTRRPGQQRGKGRAQIVGAATAGVNPATKARAKAALVPKQPAAALAQSADKIMVSNLPADVNDVQVRELFQSTVGALREVTLHYDANGRSKGTATVVFKQKGDGNRAFTQYNNRLIDGKRPMKIEIVSDPAKPAPLASRVGPPQVAKGAAANAVKTASTRGRGGRRGRGGARAKVERKPVTAADLDAEMEDWTASSANPAAAT